MEAQDGREDLSGAGACCCVGDEDDLQPVAGRCNKQKDGKRPHNKTLTSAI